MAKERSPVWLREVRSWRERSESSSAEPWRGREGEEETEKEREGKKWRQDGERKER